MRQKKIAGKRRRLKIQTLIFDRKYFRTKDAVRRWLHKNGYKTLKYKKRPITKYENTYRVRQREPYRFVKKTFRTYILARGVKCVKGVLRRK